MTFSNIFDRIGSKLIGLKFVGSSISPDLWIGVIIECFHGLGNTFVLIDVLIINVIYGIVTIRLSLICWGLIWSWPVDLVFLSFDVANIWADSSAGTATARLPSVRQCYELTVRQKCWQHASAPRNWKLQNTFLWSYSYMTLSKYTFPI